MKLKEAMSIIDKKERGFMVTFEKVEGSTLKSDHFPDKHAGEDLIPSEKEAWDLAERFSLATPKQYVNIYVIDQTFSPVSGYDKKKFKRW